MTNGEKIQKDFQGCEVCEPIVEDDIIHVIFADKKDSAIGFDLSWWNAEYKEPNKSEIPTSSTTKNDLVIDTFTHEIETEIEYKLLKRIREARVQVMLQEPIIRDNGVKNELKPTTNNCKSCKYYGSHHEGCNYCYKCSLWTENEPTTKNDLEVDCISRKAVFETIDDCNRDGLKGIFCSYDDGERFKEYIKNLPSVTPLSSELEKNSKKLEKNFGESDCISRADAIKAMQDKAKELKNEDTINGLCGAVAILYEMPPITPIRPKGHWITRPHIYGVAFCSECGFELKINNTNYCPNCGSDNREVEE